MYYGALFTFLFNKLEVLQLEAEGAFFALQESHRSRPTLTHTYTLTYSHSLTHSDQLAPRDAHLSPRGGLGQVTVVSSTTSAPPCPVLDYVQSMSSFMGLQL